MNEQIFLNGVPAVGFGGETFTTSPEDTSYRLRAGAATAMATLMGGGIGAGIGRAVSKPSKRDKYQRNGAIAGAVVGGAAFGGFTAAPMFCGLFASKDEQEAINQAQLPILIQGAAGSAAAALVGGALGSAISKKHSTIGALIGAALGSGAALTAVAATECPKLPSSGGFTIG